MTYLLLLGLYMVALFIIAWLSHRSLGVATLALAAGALLATIWTDSLTPIVAETGIVIVRPPLTSIVSVILTLLPAVLVMVRSPKVSSRSRGVVGALLFAILGVMLTYGAFSNAVVLDEASKSYVRNIVKYQNIAITACVTCAVFEVLFYRRPHTRSHIDKRE